MFLSSPSKKLTPEQLRLMRAHSEWAGGFAFMWIVGTIFIFGGIFLLLDRLGASDSVRIQSLVLLATITSVNAIWLAAGVLAGRIALIIKGQGLGEHSSE